MELGLQPAGFWALWRPSAVSQDGRKCFPSLAWPRTQLCPAHLFPQSGLVWGGAGPISQPGNQNRPLLCVFLLCVSQDLRLGTQPCCLECSQLCCQDPVFTHPSRHSPLTLPHIACWLVTLFRLHATPSHSQDPLCPFTTPLRHLPPLSVPLPTSFSPPHLHIPAYSHFTSPYLPLTPHFPLPLSPCFLLTVQPSPSLLSSPIFLCHFPNSHSPRPTVYKHILCLLVHSSTHPLRHPSSKNCWHPLF